LRLSLNIDAAVRFQWWLGDLIRRLEKQIDDIDAEERCNRR
jgi:hypothetical protein